MLSDETYTRRRRIGWLLSLVGSVFVVGQAQALEMCISDKESCCMHLPNHYILNMEVEL